ncbi:MAG: hypothetical protein V4586_19770 [Pseudomonadota bacterium]
MIRTAKPLIFTAMLGFSAGMAQAITVADVVKTYQDQAYSGIEVKESPNQIKVEAAKDGVKVEVVYDKVTGDVVKHESEVLGADETNTGLEVSSTDHDFTGDDSGDDNSAKDDSGSDDGPDHDAGDDNGGSGHDDSGHDDSGHDDSGHDGGEGSTDD